jgi:hypothetical protein
MVPTYEAYTETKRMLAGLASVRPEYQALIDWIAQEGGTGVLNVVYETLWEGRQRLDVVFEFKDQVDSFFVKGMSDRIVARLREILAEHRNTRIVTTDMFAYGFAFETAARIEANWKVSAAERAAAQARLADPSIWLLHTQFEYLTVFFQTEDQVRGSERSDIRERCAHEYAKVIAPYDEFGYVARRPIELLFDSRENFEKKYGGSWFAYDR